MVVGELSEQQDDRSASRSRATVNLVGEQRHALFAFTCLTNHARVEEMMLICHLVHIERSGAALNHPRILVPHALD